MSEAGEQLPIEEPSRDEAVAWMVAQAEDERPFSERSDQERDFIARLASDVTGNTGFTKDERDMAYDSFIEGIRGIMTDEQLFDELRSNDADAPGQILDGEDVVRAAEHAIREAVIINEAASRVAGGEHE